MRPILSVHFDRDDDDFGKFHLSFRSDDCSGRGSCWSGRLGIKEDAKVFTHYPLDSVNLPTLTLGYGTLRSDDIREIIHISASPLDARGTVGLRLRVTSEDRPEAQSEPQYSASVLLRITYQELEYLGKKLIALAEGNIDSFELEFEPQ